MSTYYYSGPCPHVYKESLVKWYAKHFNRPVREAQKMSKKQLIAIYRRVRRDNEQRR